MVRMTEPYSDPAWDELRARLAALEAERDRLREALKRLLHTIDGPSHLLREAMVIEELGSGPIANARAALAEEERE